MSDTTINTFSDTAAKRIADVVRHVESEGPPPPAGTLGGSARLLPTFARVEAAATGGGVYTGRLIFRPAARVALNPAVSAPTTFLGSPGGKTVCIINLAELGKATHTITAASDGQRVFEVVSCGVANDGKRVYAIPTSTPPGGGAVRATTTSVGAAQINPSGPTVAFVPTQGHGIGDTVYIVPLTNATDGIDWIEVINLTAPASRYKVVQVIDASGRLGLDWVRAH